MAERKQLKAWDEDVALMGPNAPEWNGHITHLIEYLLTVYERFGDTAVTADLQWGGPALHKRDKQKARIAELEADLAEWQKKAAAAVVLHEKIHECDDLKTDCERLREDAQPTNGQLSEMAYILHLVPRGDIVPVQILAVLAKQFNAALAARREKT